MTDLFTTPELIPDNVRQVLDEFNHVDNYTDLAMVKYRVELLGYTFDYDLHCEVYNLRKIVQTI